MKVLLQNGEFACLLCKDFCAQSAEVPVKSGGWRLGEDQPEIRDSFAEGNIKLSSVRVHKGKCVFWKSVNV